METNSKKKEYDKVFCKKYYAENKDYWKRKYECDICGGKYTVANKSKHMNTNKHLQSVKLRN